MHRPFYKSAAQLCWLLCLLVAPLGALTAQEEEVSNTRPAEYMIYQYPNVSLVVIVDAPEAEFSVQITGPEKALIKDSGIAHRRIGPVYQFVDVTDVPRQLMININPERKIDRSDISLELIQLSQTDRHSQVLGKAYKQLSYGMERVHTNDATSWAAKAYSFRNAAREFAGLGMEEMSLWSEYYAAHIIFHQLNDVQTAMEFAAGIQGAARRAGFDKLELAALALDTEAGMMATSRVSEEMVGNHYRVLHEKLTRRAELAVQLGFKSEQGRALYNDGLVYERQGDMQNAINRFQQALDATVTAGNSELANEIRATAAVAYEQQGSTAGAIEMRDDISGELSTDVDDETIRELADNLFEKGRLLNDSYRYPEAVRELEMALDLQKKSGSARLRGLTGLELAQSRFALGYPGQAATLIEESLPRTSRAGNDEALFRAYDSLARINRSVGQFSTMALYREKQALLARSGKRKAQHLFGTAMDEKSRSGLRSQGTENRLQQALRAAQQAGDHVTEIRSVLWSCLSRLERSGSRACEAASIQPSYEAAINSGIPRLAMEARFVHSRIMYRSGRTGEAVKSMGVLIDELRFVQTRFPGVLGAWYWENRNDIFSNYLEMTLPVARTGPGRFANGQATLLALERVRLLEASDSLSRAELPGNHSQFEELRSELGRLEAAAAVEEKGQARPISGQLADLFRDFLQRAPSLDDKALNALLNGLDAQDIVLTYYFEDDAVQLLIADRKGVRRLEIAGARQIRQRIGVLRESMGLKQADSPLPYLDLLGSRLLEPIADQLASRIWFLPSGPLNGFPFDAIRLNGEFLASNHRLVNMNSMNALSSGSPMMSSDFPQRVFIGGNPQSSKELFSYELSSTAEISVTRDRFIGPGLHIVQGLALQSDEFSDDRFSNAALIHLAIPGSIDLAFPERSRLALSASGNNESRDYLLPADVHALDVSADLVVLSGTAVTGLGRSDFDSRQGFVSEFLEAGARSVMAANWSLDDAESAEFMQSFYQALDQNSDVAGALSQARMERIQSGGETNFRSWAGFQLYIR